MIQPEHPPQRVTSPQHKQHIVPIPPISSVFPEGRKVSENPSKPHQESAPRNYTTKSVNVKPAINPNRNQLWVTTIVFNYLYTLLHSLYYRTRAGKLKIIVPSIALILLSAGLGVFLHSLINTPRGLVATIFLIGAIVALLVYMATLVGHILDAVKKIPCAERLSQFDALAFTTYVMLSSLAIVFDITAGYKFQVLILCLTYVGGNVCTLFLFFSVFLSVIWFPCVILELFARILLCRPCIGQNVETKVTYLTFPYTKNNSTTKECVICFYEYNENEVVCELRCHKSHVLHEACFLEWIKKQAICPICRAPLSS